MGSLIGAFEDAGAGEGSAAEVATREKPLEENRGGFSGLLPSESPGLKPIALRRGTNVSARNKAARESGASRLASSC